MCFGMRQSTPGCCWFRVGAAGGISMGRLAAGRIYIVEKIAFNTSHFLAMLAHRLSGGGAEAVTSAG